MAIYVDKAMHHQLRLIENSFSLKYLVLISCSFNICSDCVGVGLCLIEDERLWVAKRLWRPLWHGTRFVLSGMSGEAKQKTSKQASDDLTVCHRPVLN